jgi:response regulator of citrate/malate metabolism
MPDNLASRFCFGKIPLNSSAAQAQFFHWITRHQGRLTTAEAMKKLGLSRATVQRYFSEAEAQQPFLAPGQTASCQSR